MLHCVSRVVHLLLGCDHHDGRGLWISDDLYEEVRSRFQ